MKIILTSLKNSTLSLKPEICKFLFDLGLNGQEETISGQYVTFQSRIV